MSADVPRADIHLDGGSVGRTSAEAPVVIRAVRVGEREVIVRDSSGREARAVVQVVQVEQGDRTEVSLALLSKAAGSATGGLRPLGHNPQGYEEFWREKDAATLVRIPDGEFSMGSPEGEGEPAEHPKQLVRIASFLTDKTEVSWGQYRRFARETRRPLPAPPVWGAPESFPVSNVTWEDACAFCGWVGGRLPTEAEWDRAARGDDARPYPWGATWDPSRCNTHDGGPHAPTAVATNPGCVGPYGVLDLVGSVAEWCQDWYDAAYYAKSPSRIRRGPAAGNGGWCAAGIG